MDLSARPLTVADDDQRLYVKRRVDGQLERLMGMSANVLVRARRGAGVTSILNRLERLAEDSVAVNAAAAASADEIVHAVVARARVPRHVLAQALAAFGRADPLAAPHALRELRDALRDQGRRVVILLDGPVEPQLAHDLFGRFRDDVFAIPATWIVAAHDSRSAEYLTPPADVFFEEVATVDSFDRAGALELLRRRGAVDQLPNETVESIVTAQDGTPRSIITLARWQLRLDPQQAQGALRAYGDATALLTPTAAGLLAELQRRPGAASATDADLSHRLQAHERTLRRALIQLHEAGLVEPLPSSGGSPGRPPATFMLTELGRAGGVDVE